GTEYGAPRSARERGARVPQLDETDRAVRGRRHQAGRHRAYARSAAGGGGLGRSVVVPARAKGANPESIYYPAAGSTRSVPPSTPATLMRLPAGQSGPLTRHTVSPIATVPLPETIGFSSVNTRPTNASARRLRNGWSLGALCDPSRRHSGIAASENAAKATSCSCHDQSTAKESSPTRNAASPSHSMK